MRKRTASGLVLLALLAGTALASIRLGGRDREYRSDQFLMDTLVSIRVYGTDRARLREAVTAAYAEMHRIADLSDRFPQPGTSAFGMSDICRINEQAGIRPVRVQREVMEMLALARRYHQFSTGAFDVTIGPAMDLWGFGGNSPGLPPAGRLKETLALVSSSDLVLDEGDQTAYLRKRGMKLDLGAVAKGYATEKAVQMLKRHGIEKALVDAGGNIRVIGNNTRGTPWRIGIKNPRREDALLAVLDLEEASAVTSGDYFRSFEADGKRWHHILDPRTGYPASGNMSVTVVTENAALADVLSTAFFVMAPEKALEAAKKLPGVEVFLVAADGSIRYTPGLRDRMELKSDRVASP